MKSRTDSTSKWVFRSWCHALAAFVLLRPVHEVSWHLLALADAGNAWRGFSASARVVGRNVLVSNIPIKGLLHDMRINPSKTRVVFLSDVAP